VREGKTGRRSEPTAEGEAGAEAPAAAELTAEERDQRNREAQVALLQSTVAELTAENKALKDQVARLQDELEQAKQQAGGAAA